MDLKLPGADDLEAYCAAGEHRKNMIIACYQSV